MALLSVEKRQEIFTVLGYGEYNETSIRKLQSDYMYSGYVDGKYGKDTDNLLRHVYYVKRYTKNFDPKEFRCECGGKYCCGYPTYMKPAELVTLQAIRDHYGKSMTITCGLRDTKYNKVLSGSVSNSLHLEGRAADYYIKGVTDTLANRKASINWIKGLAYHHFTYGNGCNSYGQSPSAPNMGNAMHTDSYDVPVDGDGGYDYTVDVDGEWGNKTTITTQHVLGVSPEDGVLGPNTIKAIQKKVGATADGEWGETTTKAMQKFLGVPVDGVKGPATVKAWQTWLNEQLNPQPQPTPEPEPTPSSKYGGELPSLPISVATNNAEKLASNAESIAWALGTAESKWKYSTGNPTAACKIAMKSRGYDSKIEYSDCGYFQNTAIYKTNGSKVKVLGGVSESFKAVDGFNIAINGTSVKQSQLKRGDIVRYKKSSSSQHTLMYLGSGKICEAGRKVRFGVIRKSTKYTGTKKNIQVLRIKEGTTTRGYLQKNDVNNEVGKMQSFLNWYGNYGLVVDNDFGSASENAVKAFQKARGITQDGLWGNDCNAKAKEYEKTTQTETTTDTSNKNQQAIAATTAFARQMVKDGVYYKKWTKDTKTHQCYVCHPNSGKGVNCIGVPSMAFKHGGGANVNCSMSGLLYDGWANKLYAKSTDAERLAFWRARNGNDWELVKSPSEGCVGVCYQKGVYKHTIYCSSATTIIDSTSGQKGVKERKLSSLSSYTKIYFKYIGNGKF